MGLLDQQLLLFTPERPRAPLEAKKRVISSLNNEFHALMWEIAQSIEAFANFDFSRLSVSVSTSRSKGKFGVWAYVTPLRYVGGSLFRKGRRYGLAGQYTYEMKGVDLATPLSPLYMITILVPRFFNLSFEERLETLVHEMYHIHPLFRGDLRRFPRPHIHHGPTPRAFNARVKTFAKEALQKDNSLKHHPLLRDPGAGFEKLKKTRIASPTLRFVPSKFGIFSWILLVGALLTTAFAAPSAFSEDQSSNHDSKKLPPTSSGPQAHFISNVDYFDMTRPHFENPRYVVQPEEVMRLRAAPSLWASPMHEVKLGEKYLAYTVDESGDWVLLRSRQKQGWYPKDKLKIVGQLKTPSDIGGFNPSQGNPISSDYSSMLRKDGDKVFIPSKADWDASDLKSLDGNIDDVVAQTSGSLRESPDPLATQFGLIQKGDKLSVLKRSENGEWSYVRLELTQEEGWYPSEWIKLVQGRKVESAGMGRIVLDIDGNWGTTGRNYGYGVGGFYGFSSSSSLYAKRLEVGAIYQSSNGEKIEIAGDSETYSLVSSYTLMGIMLRYVGFSSGGLLGGALEAAGTYQQTQANLSGLDADVISETGIQKTIAPRYGFILGVRGMVSLSRTIQVNTLLRANIADSSNTYWGGLGLSFRF